MDRYVIAVALGLLLLVLLVAAVALLIFLFRESQAPAQRVDETKAVPRGVVFRRKPKAAFRRKQIQGRQPAGLPNRGLPLIKTNRNGEKIRTRTIKVNLNAVCRITGRTKRICACIKCQKERASLET